MGPASVLPWGRSPYGPAGVRFSPHDMRRTFATELADMGAGLEAVGEVLGHEDAGTTRLYVMVRPGRLRAGTLAHQVAVCEQLARARGTDGRFAGIQCPNKAYPTKVRVE